MSPPRPKDKNLCSFLYSSRLKIEPLLPAHAEFLYPLFQDQSLYTWIPTFPPKSECLLKERYTRLENRLSPDKSEAWLNWTLRLQEHPASYVGTLEATVMENGQALLAYFIFPSYQRQGFCKEACETMLSHLFDDYKIQVAALLIDTRNLASIALAESLAFKRIKTIKNADHFKGSNSDEYLYEKTQ